MFNDIDKIITLIMKNMTNFHLVQNVWYTLILSFEIVFYKMGVFVYYYFFSEILSLFMSLLQIIFLIFLKMFIPK